jgi:hypothetical protein
MQPIGHEQDEGPDPLLLLENLGVAICLSFEVTLDGALPDEMGLLLMRLALAEVLKDAADQEAQAEPESSPKEWANPFQRSLESSPCSKTWWRSITTGQYN